MKKLLVVLSALVFLSPIISCRNPIEESTKSVVIIKIKLTTNMHQSGMVGCSGVIIGSHEVLTAGHCVDFGGQTIVSDIWVKDYQNVSYRAKVKKIDSKRDLALLKVKETLKKKAVLGKSINIGEEVYSISHPLDLQWSYTPGVIAQVNRTIERFKAKFTQTTVPIAPGSSGGPLFNKHGKLIGINSMMITPCWFGGWSGISFHVSLQDIQTFLK